MQLKYNPRYASIDSLIAKARKKMPRFAFEYLDGGCNEDVNLVKNTTDIRKVELKPYYLSDHSPAKLTTELFGHQYDAPFGVAPVGLQGLMWPNAPEILAKAAYEHNLPFVLSTVSTSSIERIAEITHGRAWYQLYHPAQPEVRDDIIQRAQSAGYPVLVVLCDVPTFGFRHRDMKNGLAMPPRMTLNNILQILGRPEWAVKTLIHGQPAFETLKPYMSGERSMKQLGQFMDRTFSGRVSPERIAPIRDQWKGKLVLKGVATPEDVEMADRLGFDGVIVSNHGGRQLDAGQSAIASLDSIVASYNGKMKIMMDSGIRSGVDIARTMASGADFTFLGRTFMYSVGALGNDGGHHAMSMLKVQLQQVMDQTCCSEVDLLKQHKVG